MKIAQRHKWHKNDVSLALPAIAAQNKFASEI